MLEVSDTLVREAHLQDLTMAKEPFLELHNILEALGRRDLVKSNNYVFINYPNLYHTTLKIGVQSNLSIMATHGTNKSGRCTQIAVIQM